MAIFTLNCLPFPPDKSSSRFFAIFLQIFFFSPLVSRQVGFFAIFTLYFRLFPPGKSSSRFFCQYYPLFCNMRGAFLGRVGGFYFVRLEKKNPYLGEPRWTTSGWPSSRLREFSIHRSKLFVLIVFWKKRKDMR